MALLAKNIGMVRACPLPMKRLRVLTMQAMISENVENGVLNGNGDILSVWLRRHGAA